MVYEVPDRDAGEEEQREGGHQGAAVAAEHAGNEDGPPAAPFPHDAFGGRHGYIEVVGIVVVGHGSVQDELEPREL